MTLTCRRLIAICLLAAIVFISGTAAHGENAVRYSNASVQPGGTFIIDMVMENDIAIAGAVIPFRWSSPDISLESVTIIRDRFQGNITEYVMEIDQEARTSGVFWVSGISIFDRGWVNPGSGVLAQLHFRVSPFAPDQIAYVDSVNHGGGVGITQYSNFAGTQVIYPNVYRGTIRIGAGTGESRLEVSPASIEFSASVNGANPSGRFLTIATAGPFPLNWTASWKSTWLAVSPDFGQTSGFPLVSVEIAGLPGGVYRDTITITSAEAVNSPVLVPVTLTIEQPSMAVSPSEVNLHGFIVPPSGASQAVSITSPGTPGLPWNAQWSAPWLAVTPPSGATPISVSITADPLAMEEGIYEDVVVITAPDAGNSPQFVTVTFTVDSLNRAALPRVQLAQNVPNPFVLYGQPETRIAFYIADPMTVDMAVYDLLGRRVRTLTNGAWAPGNHVAVWDGRDESGNMVASGHYLFRIVTPAGSRSRVLVMVK